MSHQEQKIQAPLEEWGALLGKLNAICCQPRKNQSMHNILPILSAFSDRIDLSKKFDVAESCIEIIEKCGALIGLLHISSYSPIAKRFTNYFCYRGKSKGVVID